MASLEIDGDDLIIRLGPWERLGALQRGDVRVARSTITETRDVESACGEVRGLRTPGTGVLRRPLLGTWRHKGSKSFVAVRGRGPGCVVELRNGRFGRWIVSEPLPAGL
ncbi:MAG: hypothetical protein P8J50_13215 [Acidimicrobiales bacterium]|nr:hypothetical protein [Acidimicrobiales bacterium]